MPIIQAAHNLRKPHTEEPCPYGIRISLQGQRPVPQAAGTGLASRCTGTAPPMSAMTRWLEMAGGTSIRGRWMRPRWCSPRSRTSPPVAACPEAGALARSPGPATGRRRADRGCRRPMANQAGPTKVSRPKNRLMSLRAPEMLMSVRFAQVLPRFQRHARVHRHVEEPLAAAAHLAVVDQPRNAVVRTDERIGGDAGQIQESTQRKVAARIGEFVVEQRAGGSPGNQRVASPGPRDAHSRG